MNSIKFIIRSLSYYSKQHIAVFLATIISTAVLTGALIIGDSVRYSLKNLVNQRLGKIEYVLVTGDRFIGNQLSNRISDDIAVPTASLLMLEGIAINTENQKRVNKVQLFGIDKNFWALSNVSAPKLLKNEIIVSKSLAKKLSLDIGQELLLRIRNADIVPLDAPFTSDEEQTIALRMIVKEIAGDSMHGRFSLRNNQTPPYNIFIHKDFLGDKLDLEGLSNIIITSGNENIDKEILDKSLQSNITLKDLGLTLTNIDDDKFELKSTRIFIDHSFSESISNVNIPSDKILTYFVNSITTLNSETPYSFISAISEDYLGQQISNSEIIINTWLANDLDAIIGDSVKVDYFVIGPLRTLQEKSEYFIVKDIIPLVNNLFNKSLMPDFPGLSDAGNCSDWDASIPIDLKKIRDKDEEYWNDFKGTPKAFVSLEKGLELWENKFGNYTSIRFNSNQITKTELENDILSVISPNDIGFAFNDVKSQGNRAASNGVDFAELFLSLSFFIIAAAILLTILIYSLNLQNRMHEVGVLMSLGFNKKQIIRLRFFESIITIIIASIVGGLLGIIYNTFIISGLNTVWNDAIHTDLIEVIIHPSTIITGILIGIFISLLSIYIVTVRVLKKNIIGVIRTQKNYLQNRHNWLNIGLIIIGIFGSMVLMFASLFGVIKIDSTTMLLAGFLFLLGCIAIIASLFSWFIQTSTRVNIGIWLLALKNAARNKNRSIAVVTLLTIGTFTIIVTGANRLTFSGLENERNSGTGGFSLWIENTIPILQNLNTKTGKEQFGLNDENILDDVRFIQFHNLQGDDASCLNLNQVQQPQILGIDPYLFDSLEAFSFATQLVESENPWLDLKKNYGVSLIPAIADQTVIQWGLMKSIGDTISYINEYGVKLDLLLVGGLSPSVFQGNILICDSIFIENFPGSGGSKIMLADVPDELTAEVSNLLEQSLTDYGLEITLTSQRLKDFYSVTNTYLTIFMILGGLGVIIGTFGLGIVIIRNILERKKEIAVFYALGFRRAQIFKMIVIENVFLLTSGILIGTLSATIGILPSIISTSYHIPSNFLFIIISIVIISGLLWILIPSWLSLRKNKYLNLNNE
ncbi:MAG: FtsX-like permease family protein [Bacteroidetes bacterium]|nr:FtsX-like permease family protein [Bacteroidota bacterium]